MRVAFVLPHGEPGDAFFPDSLLARLCHAVRGRGHGARMVRTYRDGSDPARDARVRQRLRAWLAAMSADLIVVERISDPEPLLGHVRARAGRRIAMICRGDAFDPIEGVDFLIGAVPGVVRGRVRRSPTVGELEHALLELVDALDAGTDLGSVPGLARVIEGRLVHSIESEARPLPRPFRVALDWDVIAEGPPPEVVRATLFGNAGCPFADDPAETAHYRGLPLSPEMARLGCAFCGMGGDYQERPNAEVVAELLEQASFHLAHVTTIGELVLADQHPIPYLADLLRGAVERRLRPVRWLFAARADVFIRELPRIEAAIAEAERGGHVLEAYLTGFEAFCDRELGRLHKGLRRADLLAAVERMRALAAKHPRTFEYARARGHSLLLFTPWTTPEDLEESVRTIREHGLVELFWEMGRNRLRLTGDLPITLAAERDGALLPDCREDDVGSAHRKGYSIERPWRFLDPRTRLARELAELLRARLGPETEAAQLAAIVEHTKVRRPSEAEVPAERARIERDLDMLEAAIARLGPHRSQDAPPAGASERAATLLFGGACNNACAACPNRDRYLDDGGAALEARLAHLLAEHPRAIVLAGREPTIHPLFLELVRRAAEGGRRVGVVGNGRRFSYAAFARAAVGAGLDAASVKVFAPESGRADAIAVASGAHAEAIAGLKALRGVRPDMAIEIRAPLHALAIEGFDRHAALAHAVGADQIRIEVALDAIGLSRLAEGARAIERLAAACAREGVPLEASPLSVGTRHFDRIPIHRGAER